mmetsp:Transcript_8115/g.17609  ORF Transcript_8115/g.17609 Transcript_8115/m.17609 type:complete len:280 (-) Transcript_8115:113-952(-)
MMGASPHALRTKSNYDVPVRKVKDYWYKDSPWQAAEVDLSAFHLNHQSLMEFAPGINLFIVFCLPPQRQTPWFNASRLPWYFEIDTIDSPDYGREYSFMVKNPPNNSYSIIEAEDFSRESATSHHFRLHLRSERQSWLDFAEWTDVRHPTAQMIRERRSMQVLPLVRWPVAHEGIGQGRDDVTNSTVHSLLTQDDAIELAECQTQLYSCDVLFKSKHQVHVKDGPLRQSLTAISTVGGYLSIVICVAGLILWRAQKNDPLLRTVDEEASVSDANMYERG